MPLHITLFIIVESFICLFVESITRLNS